MNDARVVLKVDIVGRPGAGQAIAGLLAEMAELVQAYEPGCSRYDVARSATDSDRFVLWEVYEDQAAFDAHRSTPHFVEFIEQRLPDFIETRTRSILAVVALTPRPRD